MGGQPSHRQSAEKTHPLDTTDRFPHAQTSQHADRAHHLSSKHDKARHNEHPAVASTNRPQTHHVFRVADRLRALQVGHRRIARRRRRGRCVARAGRRRASDERPGRGRRRRGRRSPAGQDARGRRRRRRRGAGGEAQWRRHTGEEGERHGGNRRDAAGRRWGVGGRSAGVGSKTKSSPRIGVVARERSRAPRRTRELGSMRVYLEQFCAPGTATVDS